MFQTSLDALIWVWPHNSITGFRETRYFLIDCLPGCDFCQVFPRVCQFWGSQGPQHGAQFLVQNLLLSSQPKWGSAWSSLTASSRQTNEVLQSTQLPTNTRAVQVKRFATTWTHWKKKAKLWFKYRWERAVRGNDEGHGTIKTYNSEPPWGLPLIFLTKKLENPEEQYKV